MDDLDMVLLMTVIPCSGGQKFIPTMLPKIKKMRALIDENKLPIELEVDGVGDHLENISQISQAGADVVVAGSQSIKLPTRETVRLMKEKLG